MVPANYPVEKLLAMEPDGVLLSNGPGDPKACTQAINNTQRLLEENIPIFAICLGYQILALALSARSIKMKFGHHGANHPVKDEQTGVVLITSQNPGFAIDEASLPKDVQVTHRSLFDGTLQGISHVSKAAFGFQGHPEASPGPIDIRYLFDQFVTTMTTTMVD